MKRHVTALFAVIALAFTAASAQTQKRNVDIKATDGVNLRGTYFSPERSASSPGVLLLHQCNMDRHAWDQFANNLATAGFHVLTVDYRGFGDSGEKTSDPAKREALREKWPSDVDAMFAHLLAQKGVDKARIAVGGASCGVTQSTNLTARHPEIRVLMELSGISTEQARNYLTRATGVAIFGAASEGDTNPAQGIRELVAASKNPHSTLKIYPGTEHGVPMFAKNPELQPILVEWLKAQLMPKGAN